jgi:CBS domain-containing protein
MSRPLFTVSPDDTVATAQALLEREQVHHLLVVEHDRMVGILSSADLLKLALLLQPQPGQSLDGTAESLGVKVREVMQSKVAVVRENTSLRDAARALTLGGFHALPVLAIDDTPLGIVTSSDLVSLLIDGIDRDPAGEPTTSPDQDRLRDVHPRLLDVLRAAEIYLHSGHSDQQHARLTRAVERARELVAVEI